MDRCRHQFRRLIGRKTEHDTLIAGTFVLVALRIDTLRDMRGLFVQQVGNLTGRMVEFVLLVPDILDTGPRNVLDAAHVFGQFRLVRQTNLTADHNAVGGGKGFRSDAGLWLFGQKRIKNGVRNPVTDLVWMAF